MRIPIKVTGPWILSEDGLAAVNVESGVVISAILRKMDGYYKPKDPARPWEITATHLAADDSWLSLGWCTNEHEAREAVWEATLAPTITS